MDLIRYLVDSFTVPLEGEAQSPLQKLLGENDPEGEQVLKDVLESFATHAVALLQTKSIAQIGYSGGCQTLVFQDGEFVTWPAIDVAAAPMNEPVAKTSFSGREGGIERERYQALQLSDQKK